MKIAVFGGAFDPPHIGHADIAQYLIDSGKAERVWFLPVKIHAFGKSVTAPEHRLAMLAEVVAGKEDRFQVNTYEIEETPDQTYNKTYLTLQHFKETYPDDEFSFVIGADNLARFNEWDFYQELVQEFEIFVYPRMGAKLEPLMAGMIPLAEAPEEQFSSTEIREKVQRGESIDGLVEPQVAQYIKTHRLYVNA